MKIKNMILVSLFAALTAVGSYIYIPLPFSPVPVTLQLFFALLAGGILGKKLGVLSQIIYLMIGAIGLPVFAGGTAGIGILTGPSGGYLLGFTAAAFWGGYGERKIRSKILFMLMGLLTVYLAGTLILKLNTGLDVYSALATGVFPFLPGDLLKIGAAAYLVSRLPIDNIS